MKIMHIEGDWEMKKIAEIVGLTSSSLPANLLMLYFVISVADLHAQLNGEEIFSVNALEYVTNNLFGIAAVFTIASIFAISVAIMFYFTFWVALGVLIFVILSILSEISSKMVYKSKYNIEGLARMGRYIGYEGSLKLIKNKHDEPRRLDVEYWQLLAFLGVLTLEAIKGTQLGPEFHSVLQSFRDAVKIAPEPTFLLASGFMVVAVVVQILFLLIGLFLLLEWWPKMAQSVIVSNNLVPIFLSEDRGQEVQEIKRLEAAFCRYQRKLPNDF